MSEFEAIKNAPKVSTTNVRENRRKAETEEPAFGLRRSKRNRKAPEKYGGRFELMMPMGGAFTHARFL